MQRIFLTTFRLRRSFQSVAPPASVVLTLPTCGRQRKAPFEGQLAGGRGEACTGGSDGCGCAWPARIPLYARAHGNTRAAQTTRPTPGETASEEKGQSRLADAPRWRLLAGSADRTSDVGATIGLVREVVSALTMTALVTGSRRPRLPLRPTDAVAAAAGRPAAVRPVNSAVRARPEADTKAGVRAPRCIHNLRSIMVAMDGHGGDLRGGSTCSVRVARLWKECAC